MSHINKPLSEQQFLTVKSAIKTLLYCVETVWLRNLSIKVKYQQTAWLSIWTVVF